jgi:hypothetical protein
MKTELIIQYQHWLAFGSMEYYNQLDVALVEERYGIKKNDDGYFYLSDGLISYCNLRNGKIYRMRRNWETHDWHCYNLLYQQGISSNKFRIDIPILREEIEIDGHIWEYAELQSPGEDYGQNYNDDVFLWPELTNGTVPNTNITPEFKNVVKQYYMTFIDQSADIISAARQIAIDEMRGLPLGLSYIFNRYKDNQGYFWSDFDQFSWTSTGTDVLNDAMDQLVKALGFSVMCGVIDDSHLMEIINYGKEKWSIV